LTAQRLSSDLQRSELFFRFFLPTRDLFLFYLLLDRKKKLQAYYFSRVQGE